MPITLEGGVDVMDEYIYNALSGYYSTLEKTGYLPNDISEKLLLLGFYNDFAINDYRGIIDKEDYKLIEKALECLYGTNCLMPYPNYKMAKLHLGSINELTERVKALEETDVLKLIHHPESAEGDMESDVYLAVEEEE